MTWPHHANSVPGLPHHEPPCHLAAPHLPGSNGHEPRPNGAPDASEQTRPDAPRHAHTRQSVHGVRPRRARPRRRPRRSVDASIGSLRPQLHDDASNHQDTPTGPRERCSRRARRRRPPRPVSLRHAHVLSPASFSPQSSAASPP
jgi:hypothetical protein